MRQPAAGTIYLGTWSLVLLGPAGESDGLGWALVVVGSVLAGVVARDWLILVLALAIIPLGAAQPCDPAVERCEVSGTLLAAVVLMPIGLGLLALGVSVGKVVRRVGGRAHPPRP